MTTFVLFSAGSHVTPADLSALASACIPALADVARAWAPVYPEIEPPIVRVATSPTDFATGEIPVLFVANLGKGNEDDLAFHYLNAAGLPYALVLADPSQPLTSVQQAAWHEMAETTVDPSCSRFAAGWAVEVCDPTQGDDVPGLGGVNLSPTIFPAWFGLGSGPLDSAELLTAPGSVRPGGYAMRQDGSEIHGDGYRHAAGKLHPGSRRMRRRAKMGMMG